MGNPNPSSPSVLGSVLLALGLLLAVRWVAAPPQLTNPQTSFVPLFRGTPTELPIPRALAEPRP